MKIFYQQTGDDIISQYIGFTRVYSEQRKLYGNSRKAITETIRICKDRNLLKEYLESREKEVIDIMMTLFDQEYVTECYGEEKMREGLQKGIQKGIQKGMQRGWQKGARNQARMTARKLAGKGLKISEIAEIVDVKAETVRRWINGGSAKEIK